MAVAAISVITAGAVTAATAYQNGLNFEPKDSDRKLQNNQVVFSDDQDQVEHTSDDDGDDSELWEKNQDDDANDDIEDADKSDYLFQQNSQTSHTQTLTVSATDNVNRYSGQSVVTQNGVSGTGSSVGETYHLTDDVTNADLIINGNGQTVAQNGAGNHTESENGTGEEDQKNTNGNDDASGSDSKLSDDNDDTADNNTSDDSKNNSDSSSADSSARRPSATAKDPEIKKEWIRNDGITNNPFPETGISDITTDEEGDSQNVIIVQKWEAEVVGLYRGQTIDQTMIYNSLETYVYANDGQCRYLWGENALNEFVRIDAVSFDGGVTWKSSFPVTIPKTVDEDTMLIRVAYRLAKDREWVERQVPYEVKANRIFVLSKEIEEENTVIDEDTILNYDQNPDEGSIVNLFGIQQRYLGDEPLTELFPGWMEDGKLVPWFYRATEGRHILEPARSVPLSNKYTVQLKDFWMTDDYQVDITTGDNLVYLQTLTNFTDKAVTRMTGGTIFERIRYNELIVPEYVQAVSIDESADLQIDYLKIPDTVLYLDDSSAGLRVERGYLVDEDNPVYLSTDEGMLMNKNATEILGIPYELEKLIIPETITKANLNEDNQISEIQIEAETLESVPELNYKNIKNCKLVVPESYMEDFLQQNNAQIRQKSGNCVASADDPDVTYTMKNGIILSNSGAVRRIVSSNNTSVILPNAACQVEKGAFSRGAGIETLILPKNGNSVHLKEGSLRDSEVTEILCYSQKQYDTVKAELSRSGTDKNVSVELLHESAEGYYYRVSDTDTTLLGVPEDITSFDGVVTGEDGSLIEISTIAEQAFADCEHLEWVTLPESVKKIGYRAFEDCTELQGILINATDSITIGNEAFDGCDSLRFVASNAKEGIMEDAYAPLLQDKYSQFSEMGYFYIPTDYTGYFDGCTFFTPVSGVVSYDIVEIGGSGRMLYGLDEQGTPWLGLRSGGNVEDEVVLPESTTELFSYALADTECPSGSYTVNWDELRMLNWLDSGVFCNSDLGGSITLGNDYFLYEAAFSGCRSITEVSLGDNTYLGANVFNDCSSLVKVTLGEIFGSSSICYGLFTGCDNLRDLYFTSETPPELMSYESIRFLFNGNWTEEEEVEKIKIHVPEGAKMAYVRGWRFEFAGYRDSSDQSAYEKMWEDIRMEHMNWETWEFPSDEEVDAYVAEALAAAENRVRNLLGMEEVTAPSEWYTYYIDSYGIITLTGVPSDCKEVTLDAETLGLPQDWYLDNIGTRAFSRTKNLQKVTIPNGLAAIYSDAFAGVESEDVTLVFEGWAPDLFRSDDDILNGVPFSFGIEESRLHIQVPEGLEDFYIEMWQYIFAGYDTAEDMWNAIEAELTEQNGAEPEISEILDEMNRQLNISQNRIRAMMGLDPVDDDSTDTSDDSGDDNVWDIPDDSGDDNGDDNIWDILDESEDDAVWDTADDGRDENIWDIKDVSGDKKEADKTVPEEEDTQE